MTSKILTTLNQALSVQIYDLQFPDGSPLLQSTLNGLPLGTHNNSSTGELGLKVILIGDRSGMQGFNIPAHDEVVITYIGATNNINTVTYKLASATVATLTMEYSAGGAANDDLLTGVVKS